MLTVLPWCHWLKKIYPRETVASFLSTAQKVWYVVHINRSGLKHSIGWIFNCIFFSLLWSSVHTKLAFFFDTRKMQPIFSFSFLLQTIGFNTNTKCCVLCCMLLLTGLKWVELSRKKVTSCISVCHLSGHRQSSLSDHTLAVLMKQNSWVFEFSQLMTHKGVCFS